MSTFSHTHSDAPLSPRVHRLSVILPVRNQRKWAEKAVYSILSSADPLGTELHVIDDASRDGTYEHLHSVFGNWISEGRLSIQGLDKPCGDIGKLWNRGAQATQGSTLAFARPSTLWGPLRLTRLHPWLSQKDLIATRRAPRPQDPTSLNTEIRDTEWGPDVDWVRVFLQENVAAPGSMVIKRPLFDSCHGFTEGYSGVILPRRPPGSEEYELLLKALLLLEKEGRLSRFTLLKSQIDELQEQDLHAEIPVPQVRDLLRSAEELKERVSLITLTPKIPVKYWKTLASRVKERIS